MARRIYLGIVAGMLVGVAAVLWVAVPGTSVQAESDDELAQPYVVSDVVVHYRVFWGDEEHGEGTAPGQGTPFRTMIIRENSIILVAEGGGGMLLPINDSLRSFSWTKQ